MRLYTLTFLLLLITAFITPEYAFSQEETEEAEDAEGTEEAAEEYHSRGSIPEALLRPARGESPRYPIDTVIGELGRGRASQAAYDYAVLLCDGFLSIDMNHATLTSIASTERESILTTLNAIDPLVYRLGGGRNESDGAISFLVRFIGKDKGITGELYIRFASGKWKFDELLLDEAKDRDVERRESIYRNDFNPYERFY